MNKGVEILLARMESNPEEFNGEINRWGDLLQYYKTYLNPDDANALNEGINKTIQQRFTEKVMEELLDPKSLELEDVIKQYRATGISSVGQTLAQSMAQSKAMSMGATLTSNGGTGTTGTTWANTATNTLTIGNQTLDQETIEHMKAHLDWIKREEQLKKQANKKHWWNKSIPELLGTK
jgi:hypothetical protein